MTTPTPLPKQTLDVEGQPISFSVADLRAPWAQPATPIFLVHGLGLSAGAWRPWIATLAAERPVVAVDLRGHGGSTVSWTEEDYPLERFGEDIRLVADELGFERFHYVGESFGGTIGLGLAIAHPDRVESVTVCSTAFDGSRITHVGHWPELSAQEDGVAKWSEELIRGRLGPEPDAALAAYFAESQRVIAPRVIGGVVHCLQATDLTEELTRLQTPVLVITPERSPFVDPVNAEALAAAALNGELAFVPNAFHGVVLSHWRECVDLLQAFLARLEESADPSTAAFSRELDGRWVAGIGSHVAIEVPDIEEGVRFYRDVLGLELDWRHEISGAFLESVTGLEDARGQVVQLLCPGGSRVELWCHHPRGEGGTRKVNDTGFDHLSFGVRDVQAAYERLSAAGVEFTVAPVDVADPAHPLCGWQAAYFEDPWGTRLEIVGPDPIRGLHNGERAVAPAS
jgi:pimeloyl-ACP methyl ester carboxylesterase/catechol 2,3-dioxygenase-like lactoylglutathione lyase family enzyme